MNVRFIEVILAERNRGKTPRVMLFDNRKLKYELITIESQIPRKVLESKHVREQIFYVF